MTDLVVETGITYRIRYQSSKTLQREATGMYLGQEVDPMVQNLGIDGVPKTAYKFSLTSPRIANLDGTPDLVLDVTPDEPIWFHLWPEDLVSVTRLTNGTP